MNPYKPLQSKYQLILEGEDEAAWAELDKWGSYEGQLAYDIIHYRDSRNDKIWRRGYKPYIEVYLYPDGLDARLQAIIKANPWGRQHLIKTFKRSILNLSPATRAQIALAKDIRQFVTKWVDFNDLWSMFWYSDIYYSRAEMLEAEGAEFLDDE